MIKKIFTLIFASVCLLSCQQQPDFEIATSPLDGGRYFIESCLQGEFKKAKFYLLSDGRAYTDATDHTCGNWTSEAADGIAQLGHFDRNGGGVSWNSAHPSRGCSQPNLVATGGAGLFYCFAIGPR